MPKQPTEYKTFSKYKVKINGSTLTLDRQELATYYKMVNSSDPTMKSIQEGLFLGWLVTQPLRYRKQISEKAINHLVKVLNQNDAVATLAANGLDIEDL